MRKYLLALLLLSATPTYATDFTVTITNTTWLAGLAYSRAQVNAAVTAKSPPNCILDINNQVTNAPCLYATDADYVKMLVTQAVISYAQAQTAAALPAAVAAAKAGDATTLKALADQLVAKTAQ